MSDTTQKKREFDSIFKSDQPKKCKFLRKLIMEEGLFRKDQALNEILNQI